MWKSSVAVEICRTRFGMKKKLVTKICACDQIYFTTLSLISMYFLVLHSVVYCRYYVLQQRHQYSDIFFQSLHISDMNTSVRTELHIAFFTWRNSSCSNCFTQRLSDMATAHFHGESTPPFANVNMRPIRCMWLVEYAIEQASLGLPCRRY